MNKGYMAGVGIGLGVIALTSSGVAFADSMEGKEFIASETLNLICLETNAKIGRVLEGDTVTVLEDLNDGFVKVKTKYGRTGKCAKDYLNVKEAETNILSFSRAATSSGVSKVVNTEGLNLRSGAGSIYPVLKKLTKGTKVEAFEVKFGWRKVKAGNTIGWVADQYLSTISTNTVSSSSSSTTKFVNTEELNFRKGPGTNYVSIKKLSKNTKVTEYESKNGWSKIKVSGQEGWVASRYLSSGSSNSSNSSVGTTKKVIGTDSVNVRKDPSTKNARIGTLKRGASVTVISTSNGWSKIKYDNGYAYVSSQYLGESEQQSQQGKQFNNVVNLYRTKYNHTLSRAKNIELAAKRLDNVIIQPNQYIDFKALIGKITAANGYVEAPVMSGGVITGNGIGGGVCQVSSTLYNAALLSGLTNIESKNHSGRVSYTPAGTDAVISEWQNLRIKNTYKEAIMIDTSCSNGVLTIQIKSVNALLGGKQYKIKTISSSNGLTVRLDLVETKGGKSKVVYQRISRYVR